MAFSCGFFDAINNDRTYSSTQFGEMFDGLITDGIYSTIGNAFAVVPGSGVQIKVRSGRAWFNKTWSVNTADLPIDLEVPDLLLPRIDVVILEVDTRVVVRNNSIKVITGTPNVTPTKPTLVRADGLYQYPLAWITVEKNVSSISATKIENNIGKDPTPFVTGILKSVDITELWTQWNGQFDEWFSDVQSQLSGDIAGNLLKEIQDVSAAVKTKLAIADKATLSEVNAGSTVNKYIPPNILSSWFTGRRATGIDQNNTYYVSPPLLKSNMDSLKSEIANVASFSHAIVQIPIGGGSIRIPSNLGLDFVFMQISTDRVGNFSPNYFISVRFPVIPGERLTLTRSPRPNSSADTYNYTLTSDKSSTSVLTFTNGSYGVYGSRASYVTTLIGSTNAITLLTSQAIYIQY